MKAVANRKLCIGYFYTDGFVHPHPPIMRNMNRTLQALKKNGHKIVEFKFPDPIAANDLVNRIFHMDGGNDIGTTAAKSGEPIHPNIKLFTGVGNAEPLTISQLWELNIERYAYQTKFLEYWNSVKSPSGEQLDAIICPASASAAIPHNEFKSASYTAWVNLMDLPSTVIPTGFADKSKDIVNTNFVPIDEKDAEFQKMCMF